MPPAWGIAPCVLFDPPRALAPRGADVDEQQVLDELPETPRELPPLASTRPLRASGERPHISPSEARINSDKHPAAYNAN